MEKQFKLINKPLSKGWIFGQSAYAGGCIKFETNDK